MYDHVQSVGVDSYHWWRLGLLLHRHWDCTLEQLLRSQQEIQLAWPKKKKNHYILLLLILVFFFVFIRIFAQTHKITWVAHTLSIGKGDPCGCRAVYWIHGRLQMLQLQKHRPCEFPMTDVHQPGCFRSRLYTDMTSVPSCCWWTDGIDG